FLLELLAQLPGFGGQLLAFAVGALQFPREAQQFPIAVNDTALRALQAGELGLDLAQECPLAMTLDLDPDIVLILLLGAKLTAVATLGAGAGMGDNPGGRLVRRGAGPGCGNLWCHSVLRRHYR